MCFLLNIRVYCYARRLVVECMVVVRSRCHHQCIPRSVVAAVLDPSVIVSSTTDPPRLSSQMVASGDWRFGRVVDDDDDGLPSQSVSNINRIMTSSSCLLSLLVSVVFVVVLLFPKRPSQSRRRITFKKSRAYPPASASVSSSSSVATPLPLSPSQSSHPHRHRRHRGRRTPPPPRRPPLSRRSSRGGSRLPG